MQATASSSQPPVDALAGDMASLLIYVLKTSGSDFFRTMAELDLSFTQIVALNVLDTEDRELSVKELADALTVSLPTASRVVEVLHRHGYVERREGERDRRVKLVRITPSGREVPARVHGARIAALQQFLTTLTTPERQALAAALEPIVARAEISACRLRGACP